MASPLGSFVSTVNDASITPGQHCRYRRPFITSISTIADVQLPLPLPKTSSLTSPKRWIRGHTMWQRRALCRLSAISIILIISLYFVVFNRLVKTVILPFGDNASIKGVVLDPYVNRFTGIPFAVPPTGENRWKKPVKLSPMSFQNLKKPYDATRFKDRCLQSYTPSGSEPHPSVISHPISASYD